MSDSAMSLPLAEALDRTRRQLIALDELTGHGLAVSRALAEQASGERAQSATTCDHALAYARVSRAVRLAIALQQQLIKDLAAAAADAQTPEDLRKARLERIVERQVRERHPSDDEALDRLMTETADRLDDEDLYGDLMDRPFSELVARICSDIGLEADWPALSQELWARREIASGDVGAPLMVRMSKQARPPPPEGTHASGFEKTFGGSLGPCPP